MTTFREFIVPPDVLGVFERVSQLPYPILFDSATAGHPTEQPMGQLEINTTAQRSARYSFVAADPWAVVRAHGQEVIVKDRHGRTIVRHQGRALDIVERLLQDRARVISMPQAVADDGLPPFQGGAAGYIGYEYGGVLERLPRACEHDLALPDAVLGLYDWVIAWDHVSARAWIMGEHSHIVEEIGAFVGEISPLATSASHSQQSASDDRASLSRGIFGAAAGLDPEAMTAHAAVTSTFTQSAYETAVNRVREYIVAGEIFQANLSQRFTIPLCDTPWAMYRRLRTLNPAPFASYFDFGDAVIVSASPERFLHVTTDGFVETRPIKGTRPRATELAEDLAYREALLHSEKDAAEHAMIVDVLRNDLARVCAYGSVCVPTFMAHEPYATVHHLVSTITGQLCPDRTAIDLIHVSFPGGSITGAPKIRAMEIIAELEPVTRGVYCGAIGYLSTTGALDMSIAIRTAVVNNGLVYCSAGGGIVADSEPTAEYYETLVKAQAIIAAVPTARSTTMPAVVSKESC